MAKTSITFLYPSMNIGGAQLLFIRLAKELSLIEDIEVSVIDYSGGYLETKLKKYQNIKLLTYNGNPIHINSNTTIITPFTNILHLNELVTINTASIGLLFWATHPDSINYLLYRRGRKWFVNKNKTKSIIKYLSERGNIVYMDAANYNAVKAEINSLTKPFYIPIPISIGTDTQSILPKVKKNSALNIGWLGRISYDKIYAIYKIADEIQKSDYRENIIFHIIGDGDRASELVYYLKKCGISYRMPGVIEKEKLTKYLIDEIDLGIAMGTSCLELALRKIPTIIIDFSFKKYPEYIKYNWLFETKCYTLGNFIDIAGYNNHCFTEILQQLEKDPNLGQQCYKYVINHHNIVKVSGDLVKYLYNAPCIDVSEIRNFDMLFKPIIYCYLSKFVWLIKKFGLGVKNLLKKK